MITFVVIQSGWVLIMGFLDLGWYSRLLEVSFALLFHGDCLSCLPGLQHARKTCCAGAEQVLHQYSMAGSCHGIPRPRLAHLCCWESVLHCYLTVSCCCGLPGFLWKNCSDSSYLDLSSPGDGIVRITLLTQVKKERKER